MHARGLEAAGGRSLGTSARGGGAASFGIWLVAVAVSCGGAAPPRRQGPVEAPDVRPEPAESDDGIAVEGLLGTLSQDQIRRALEPREPSFLRCVERRLGAIEWLGGEVRLAFRVARDGSVRWVYLARSTLGDAATEACILEVARRVRFETPRGGEAEVGWSFAVDPPDDVRPPLRWEPERLGEALQRAAEAVGACAPGERFGVTVYVGPGGRVLSAGVATRGPEASAASGCVVEAIGAIQMPDPGSYPAKVSFEVP
ncbi:MAG: TonB family protein [Myxococcales bacterium]|nr:TonB family protein [Myxococcales bacterium]